MLSWAEFRGALLALGGLLVLVFAVIVVHPGLPGELLLQSLRFHLILAGLGLAVLTMIVGARWRGGLLLAIVLAAGVHGALYVMEFQQRRVDYAGPPAATLDFLSFNVLTGNRRSEELVQSILADPPDVALIMETPGIEDYLDQVATVLPYRAGCSRSETCDISLHSSIPFDSFEVRDLPPLGRERVVIGKITVAGQGVTVVGIHLSKPYYDNTSEIELWLINRMLSEIEGPLILAGDFNSASWTDPVAEIGRSQNLAPGPTQPATWPVRLGPLGVPIDNMFTRGSAQIMSLVSGDSHGSNHRPLRAEIGLYPAED
ncbi:Endonuclease/Exonuclease/phosphatase family protein [Devosia lucknowensis]|uniref:Endonuclease/Exonuclease/phosphatase family protein n=1 Tax=Devosia lucknowensis TaxID=1096929 RepID=A0A1Y6F319_9HYPH|nr:endonuclease/exonuclease/phosphatase family protein [Devosia lucknowensis]SMQ67182.1 Endonuclease/Exonuclease/phosphatase family protein [Devosia lucknowensis]